MYICSYFCCVNLVETVLPSRCCEFSLSIFWNGIDFYIINVSLYLDVFFSIYNPMEEGLGTIRTENARKKNTLGKWAGILSAICRAQEHINNLKTVRYVLHLYSVPSSYWTNQSPRCASEIRECKNCAFECRIQEEQP